MSLHQSIFTHTHDHPVTLAARLPFLVRALLLFAAWLAAGQLVRAQEIWTVLPTITDFKNTEAKPQSKVWFHGHTFWTVLAGATGAHTGTWIMRLEPDNTWSYVQQISTNTGTKADVKVVGNVVHILMHNSGSQLHLAAVRRRDENVCAVERATDVDAGNYVGETGTIDIDSNGRMWLATESIGIEMYYSDYPYTTFTGPIILANDVDSDDIAVVTALPNHTVGVFWSNQATKKFAFKYHVDGADPFAWSGDEAPGAAAAVNDGIGLAEDHINTAVGPTERCMSPSRRDTASGTASDDWVVRAASERHVGQPPLCRHRRHATDRRPGRGDQQDPRLLYQHDRHGVLPRIVGVDHQLRAHRGSDLRWLQRPHEHERLMGRTTSRCDVEPRRNHRRRDAARSRPRRPLQDGRKRRYSPPRYLGIRERRRHRRESRLDAWREKAGARSRRRHARGGIRSSAAEPDQRADDLGMDPADGADRPGGRQPRRGRH